MSNKYIPPHRRANPQQTFPSSSSSGSGSGNGSGSANRRTNNNNNNNNSFQTRGSQQHRSFKNSKRIMFFGDSFVRLFGLLQHPDISVCAFKGASAKGLGREGNLNRDSIYRQVQQQRPERVILVFGNVDVHLSYYFTKYSKEGPIIDLKQVAEAYVEFAASLLPYVTQHIHIVGVYPSPLQCQYVVPSLEAYQAISAGTTVSEEDISIEARQNRVQEFNENLKLACEKYGLLFEDAYSDIIDPDTHLLKPSFQDVSLYNIHIVWETTILLWLEKWPWLRVFADADFPARIQKTLEEYLATKPWTNVDHIAANIGVGEAFDMTRTET